MKLKKNLLNYKNIYLGRNDVDKFRNRRKIINEKSVLKVIKKKYSDLKVIRPGFIPVIETIKYIYNCERLFSPLGTQLVLNSLFAKNLKLIFEMVPEKYYGFTTAQLVSKFKNSMYKKSITHNVKPGWPLYTNQKANIRDLKKKIKL